MRRLFHPSRAKLRDWIDHLDPKVDAHVEVCNRCASILEDIDQPGPSLANALRSMLAPPADLEAQLRAGISRKLAARADMELLGEMMGLQWRTLKTLSEVDPDDVA